MGIEPSIVPEICPKVGKNSKLDNQTPPPPPPPLPPPTTVATRSGKKIRRRQRKQQQQQPNKPMIQTLFENCKEVFANGGAGFIPPPDHVQRLRSILDSLKPDDVGLSPDMPYFRARRIGNYPIITYLHLYECDNFSMGIFCLPPSGVLPLHNHPGMTVFSKLLFGTMHIKSYDWATDVPCTTISSKTATSEEDEDVDGGFPLRLAKVNVDAEMVAPCNTSILYPAAGGNMHCFTAVTACAVLDVLGPPYSDPDGRHCAYYREFPFHHFSVDGLSVPENEKGNYAWLQEKEKPSDLMVLGAPYRGPEIVDS